MKIMIDNINGNIDKKEYFEKIKDIIVLERGVYTIYINSLTHLLELKEIIGFDIVVSHTYINNQQRYILIIEDF